MKDPALTELRKQLRETAPAPAPKPAAKPAAKAPEEKVDDATLFARATQGVKRIQAEAPPAAGKPGRPDANTLRRRAAAVEEQTETGPISDTAALMHAVQPEEFLSFARNGVQPRALQKLKQAQQPWQAAVDLHGCTVDQAREAVLKLVSESHREGLSVIKIVHGKGLQNGQPLIKTCVNGWLRQIPQVLAFVSALPRDGGTGAAYVLLKKAGPPRNPE
ncbi:MAG: Smr/MutS family protein [Pedobacter sp.]|nr:Smr/MutS family protein [Pedobacter sp.]